MQKAGSYGFCNKLPNLTGNQPIKLPLNPVPIYPSFRLYNRLLLKFFLFSLLSFCLSQNMEAQSRLPLGFSTRVMESLSAVCDTFVPPCSSSCPPPDTLHPIHDCLQTFYQLSASDAKVPEHVAELLQLNLQPSKLWAITRILWLLSTGVGTFLLFGRRTISGSFPYFHKFAKIPLSEREQLLLTWSHSRHRLFRLVFRALKGTCFLSLYTKVDKRNHNPTWSAIGYCGPDPEALAFRKKLQGEQGLAKPLRNVIAGAALNLEALSSRLKDAGLPVVDVPIKNRNALGIKCDVVVVGSGSGGGVCAGVLAQSGLKVVVLEKGEYIARNDLSLLEGPSLQDMYERGGMAATEHGNVNLMAGSTVGGGSAVNWGASFRTPPHVLKEWEASYKLGLFTTPEYEKALDITCARIGVQKVSARENLPNTVLRKGCQKLGYHVDDVPLNSDPDHFCGWCGFGCWNGKKKATSETWLADATAAGAIILTGCRAREVVQRERKEGRGMGKSKKAVGVIASIGTGPDKLLIEAGVVMVACGSLHTPGLLLQSGLRNNNIGKNLHLHVSQNVWGYFPECDQGLPGTSYEGNSITAFSKEAARLDSSGYGTVLENPAMHPGAFASSIPWISGFDHKQRMTRFARTVHIFALVRDRGSGTLNGRGDIRYDLDTVDEKLLKEAGEKALRVLIAAGAEEVGTHNVDGDRLKVVEASEREIEEFLKEVGSKGLKGLSVPLFSAHQMGSCRMGVSPETSVVDARGETWEVEGLFVADASVFPTALGVNPMVTVQAIAYCISHKVLEYMNGNGSGIEVK